MILVFGGTTEGRRAVQALEEAGTTFYYSTRGSRQEVEMVHGKRLQGTMDDGEIISFCQANDIRLLVDATHPFAVNVHRNIAMATRTLQIPLIRYERQYPPHTDDIRWCKDYEDAVVRLHEAQVTRLLALTGVQTIGKLKRYWKHPAKTTACWFRILNREESQQVASKQGFPEDRLVYYQENNTAALIQQLQPQAILTKESGYSGGFEEKVNAARAAGVQVFVVCKPQLPTPHTQFYTLNGSHALRLKIQQLLPEFFPLKIGLTTGTCATAAAKAALGALLGHAAEMRNEQGTFSVSVRIPDGEDIEVVVDAVECNGDEASATVIKYAGDDPDITDGLAICATVRRNPSQSFLGKERENEVERIVIKGGEGVGIVTLPGLGLPMGAPAINETPQSMIRENLSSLLSSLQEEGRAFEVTISVPEGSSIAKRTFNPRIGVVGGISIIGTSGIVKPFSSDAWISSIRKEMSVGLALSAHLSPQIVINSGAKSEGFLRVRYPDLPQQSFVHYGNFIGETLKIAAELGVRHLAMGLMIGKAVKLAEGNLDTHSHKVTMNRAFIQLMIEEAGITLSPSLTAHLSTMNMARELWDILPADDMRRLSKVLIAHCHAHCDPLLPDARLEIQLISDQGTVF